MEVITLKVAKEFLRIDNDDEDEALKAIISSCVDRVQGLIKKPFGDYGQTSSDIPLQIRQACLLLIGQSHEHGTKHPVPMLVDALLMPHT